MRLLLLLITGGCCACAIGFFLFSAFCAVRFFSGLRQEPAEPFLPPVSVLKSLCGVDPGTEENLASFCRQDYPRMQILFGVSDPADPVIPVVRRLIQRFPDREIGMVFCGRALGMNPKVSSLIQMEGKARHLFLLICDDDIRVGADALRRMVLPLKDPRVGAVTCMCRSMSKGWIGTLEALREVTEFCPGVLAANRIEGGMRFGLGSAILLKREALERIGGLASIADYLADDYLLGSRIARAGWTVLLSDVVVEHELAFKRLGDFARRQVRWNRGIRVCRPWGYRGLLLTHGVPMSVLFLLLSGFSRMGWAMLGAVWSCRLAAAHLIGARCFGDRAARRYLWLTPVQDLLSFACWCAGLFGRRIHWRGRSFRLSEEGKLDPPVPVSS